MRTDIPEKRLKIGDHIDEPGNVNLTRLVVLKKWFEKPERLSAFAIWIGTRATSRKGKTGGAAAELFSDRMGSIPVFQRVLVPTDFSALGILGRISKEVETFESQGLRV